MLVPIPKRWIWFSAVKKAALRSLAQGRLAIQTKVPHSLSLT